MAHLKLEGMRMMMMMNNQISHPSVDSSSEESVNSVTLGRPEEPADLSILSPADHSSTMGQKLEDAETITVHHGTLHSVTKQ